MALKAPELTIRQDFMLNVQESIELQYFQTIQIQRLEIKALKQRVGELESEVDHLTYQLANLSKEERIQAEALALKDRLDQSNTSLRKQIQTLKRDKDILLNKLLTK